MEIEVRTISVLVPLVWLMLLLLYALWCVAMVTGAVLAVASNDATIKMYEVANGQVGLDFIFFK